MTWVEFPDDKTFTQWHDQKCVSLGIPQPGARQSDQKLQIQNQWTTAYVEPILDGTTIKALVPQVDAKGLTPTTAPKYPTPEDPTTTVSKVAFTTEKPLPATWLVDGVITPVPTATTNPVSSEKLS